MESGGTRRDKKDRKSRKKAKSVQNRKKKSAGRRILCYTASHSKGGKHNGTSKWLDGALCN